jgi:hypothetical protein
MKATAWAAAIAETELEEIVEVGVVSLNLISFLANDRSTTEKKITASWVHGQQGHS